MLASLLLLAGCRNNGELVEAELRNREREVRELKDELSKLEWHNEALQRELSVSHHEHPPSPEQAAQLFELRRIVLGRATGGYDEDHRLGDDALQVVVEPHDGEDHIIKAPGALTVTALEVNTEGIKTPFSTWTIPPEKLRSSWKSGLFSNGYVLVLPWQTPPHCEHVRVVARLQTSDGRQFEADRDVRVVLRPEMLRPRPPAPVIPPPAGPALPNEPTPLPAPRPAEPPVLDGPSLSRANIPSVEPAAHWTAPGGGDELIHLRGPQPLEP